MMLCDVATACWRKLTPDFLLVGGVSLQGGIAEHHAHALTAGGQTEGREVANTVPQPGRVALSIEGVAGSPPPAVSACAQTTTTEAARMFLGRGARAASGGSV